MIIISHRANLIGPSDRENHPDEIKKVLKLGIDCEIDLWYKNNSFILGHDEPQYEVNLNFIKRENLWIHCKNLKCLEIVVDFTNCFWHQNDDFTLTSNGLIWTFPNKKTCKKSIIVDNNKNWKDLNYNCHGICTDWVL